MQQENYQIFDVCAKIESCFAELYFFFSEFYSENVEAVRLWKKAAAEEENHIRQFEFADRLYRMETFMVNIDLGKARIVLNKVREMLVRVRQNPPDLETAVAKAIELEEKLSDFHMAYVVEFEDESIQQVFISMARADKDHIQQFRNFIAALVMNRRASIANFRLLRHLCVPLIAVSPSPRSTPLITVS